MTNEEFADKLWESVEKRDNIVVCARKLGCTIAELSRELGKIAEDSPSFKKIFKKLKWPLNVSVGHIFVGGPATSNGPMATVERADVPIAPGSPDTLRSTVFRDNRQLSKYDYVMAEKVQHKPTYEIFEAVPVKQVLIHIGYYITDENGKEKFKVVKRVWLSKRAILNGRVAQICAENPVILENNKRMKLSVEVNKNTTRISYRKGRWLDTPNKMAVVSVNYDWK